MYSLISIPEIFSLFYLFTFNSAKMYLQSNLATVLLLALPATIQAQRNAYLAPIPFPTDVCAITSWPTGLPGKVYTPQLPDSELTGLLRQIDPIRIKNIIEKLASFGTRHTCSSQTDPERGIGAARDWLLKQYQGFAKESEGRMTVELHSYIQPVASRIPFPTNISNVVATLRGSEVPERFVVIR